MNPLTGECPVDIGGQTYTLRFVWAAVAEIQSAYGDDPNFDDLATLAAVGAAGLRLNHPEMTVGRLMELSPPILAFGLSVEQAWRWAFLGNEPPGAIAARAAEQRGQKADDPPGAGSRRPIRWPWKRASTSTPSGE